MPSSNEDDLRAELGEPVAGNGLLHRRAFLRGGALFAGTAGALAAGVSFAANPIALDAPASMLTPGRSFSPYGTPAGTEAAVVRTFTINERAPATGSSRTPHHLLNGIITPSGLHFERHHNGVPTIDPAEHRLTIHGLVDRPLVFTMDALMRYPMESMIRFVECAGNSGGAAGVNPVQNTVQGIHGLLSCSEWTGVRLSVLLQEAGVQADANWILAEGADAAAMSRSIPLEKAMDDTLLALYQNGEAIRPEQGYPMRLLVPGFQGNLNVKWVRRIELTNGPTHTKDETSKYTELMPNGIARQFWLEHGVKSFIARPSYGVNLTGPGLYEISGLAWSGAGRISRVEVSADNGASWTDAALGEPIIPKALTRFRLPWEWSGQPVVLMSRATDERGNVQPTHDAWRALFAPGQSYMYNGIQNWAIDEAGEVLNV
ncbi:MAG: sulfite dehydrogenase [Bauldia sp.]